jgi:hypothetical protein
VKMASPGAKGHPPSQRAFDSVWWKLFTERKALTEGRLHAGPDQCRNRIRFPAKGYNGCGIALHPEWGAPGSPWRDGHRNMDAHRVVQKALLVDLWRVDFAARDLGPHPETAARRVRRARP